MKIEKSKIEIYYLRGIGDCGWADISIDEGKKSGRISIASDWGSWENYWGACGESFKKFLGSLNMEYFAGKVGEDRWLDTEKTLQNWKQEVLEYRRRDDIEAEYARNIYNEIKELEDAPQNILVSLAYEKENFMKFHNYHFDTHTSVSPRFRNFWEKCYTPFVKHLEDEASPKKVCQGCKHELPERFFEGSSEKCYIC